MEPFENNEFEPTPEPIPENPPLPPRRESPYANSPYEMDSDFASPPRPPKSSRAKKERKPILKPLLAVILGLALVAGSCFATAAVVASQVEDRFEDKLAAMDQEVEDLRKQVEDTQVMQGVNGRPADGSFMTPSQLYVNCVHSVVAISTTVPTTSFYGTTEGTGAGSGFILSEDGYVITNYHVVEGASAITVTTHSGEEYDATLVGFDSTNDLAVLDLDAEGLSAASLGSSTGLAIGDMVVAIGNPLGELSATQTVGYISGIDREVSTDNLTTISMLQTDAAINPGNSGGPLFNMYGQVIGITTAKYSGTTGSGASIEGIGFAIPIDDVTSLIDDLIDFGYVTGAYMGVTVQNTDEESAAMFGLPTGAYIVSVEDGGAADRAGIRPKDIVIRLGDYTVKNVTDLTRSLRNFKAGDSTQVIVIRGGKELSLTITLDEKPQQNAAEETQPQPESPPAAPSAPSAPDDFDEMYEYFRRFFGF